MRMDMSSLSYGCQTNPQYEATRNLDTSGDYTQLETDCPRNHIENYGDCSALHISNERVTFTTLLAKLALAASVPSYFLD
jgi:hypothetical protein